MDLANELETRKKSYLTYHELTTVPMNGYKDGMDYVKKAAPYNRIPSIKTPTMFLNSVNDPFMGEKVIDYEVFKGNPNVVLGTN
jgi:predicted alpha/beta-fold hydrolase